MSQTQTQQATSCFNDKDYYVVEFPNEVTNGKMAMSIVPYTWLNVDHNNQITCLWPSFKNDKEFNIAVHNKDEPDLKNCRKCDVNVKYKTKNYENAVNKLKLLENESGLSSSSGSEDYCEQRSRRRIFKNSRYTDAVSDDELPKIPKPIKSRNYNNKFDDIHSDNLSKSPKRNTFENDTSKNLSVNMHSSCADLNISDNDVTLTEVEPVYTFQRLQETVRHSEDLLKRLITKMDILSSDLKYTTMLIQNPQQLIQKEYKESDIVNSLPVTTVESLQQLETKLQDPKIFFDMCASSLTVIGGRDMKETVRRLLAKILSHNVALTINWSGKNEKLAFKQCENTVKLILAITRKNPMCSNVTCQEVESVIKVWLRSAGDRMGGRDKRRTN